MNIQSNRIDSLEVLLVSSIGNDFDWVCCNRYSRNLTSPLKISDDIMYFADALKEIVLEKLTLALESQEQLKKLREKRIKRILDGVPEDKQWFYLLLEKHLFSEYFVIGAWISYWLRIWGMINEKYIAPFRPQYKYSETDILQAKEYPINNLYKGKLRKSGKRFVGLCPFHEERTPSFYIFDNNTWHCFGACNTGGDSINFLMKQEHIGFIDAVRRLYERY